MLAFAVLAPAFSILTFLIWTAKIVYDFNEFKYNRKLLWWNIIILALPYIILMFFLLSFLFKKGKEAYQRASVTINVNNYDSLLYPVNFYVHNFVRNSDSVLLYINNFEKHNVSTLEYAFYKNGVFQTESRGLFDRLCLFKLKNNLLSEIKPPDYNDSLTSYGINIIQIEEPVSCITYGTLAEQPYTIIRDTCQPNKSDTLWGYVTDNHGARNITYTDKDGTNYILFCTEPSTYNPTMLFIGELRSRIHKVHKLNLTKEDGRYFDPRQVITIFKMNNRFYILSHRKIIWFRME